VTVYIAAIDETQNAIGDFLLGGYVAPEDDWDRHFVPAWKERVLGGKRPIPYLHMREIWTEDWQRKHGISGSDAYWAVEEAATVIMTMGCLAPVTCGVGVSDWKTILADPIKKMGGSHWEIVRDPDYLCFIGFSILIVGYIHDRFPDATKIHFLIEESEKTTGTMKGFHQHVSDFLETRLDLLPLVGELRTGGKESVPLQAADTLCWYAQRQKAGLLKKQAERRRFWMISNRTGIPHLTTPAFLSGLAEHLLDGMRRRRAARRSD
jgi:hypothetical protein